MKSKIQFVNLRQEVKELSLLKEQLPELLPEDVAIEKWFKKNKRHFKKIYGDTYKNIMIGLAWKVFSRKQKLKEGYVYFSPSGQELSEWNMPRFPGEKNVHNKLSFEDVCLIKARKFFGERTQTLVREYGVGKQLIDKIAAGTRWKHVTLAMALQVFNNKR